MRIDLTQATVAVARAEVNSDATRKSQAQPKTATVSTSRSSLPPDRAPSTGPQPQILNVTIDQNKNTIYRFTDEKTGDLIRQVPPEEVLRIMRNVEEVLQESEQKLKVTA